MLILPEWMIARPGMPPLQHWGVRIQDSFITDLLPAKDLLMQYPQEECVLGPNQVLSPGFVNAHTHCYGVLAHGIHPQKPVVDFWSFLEDFWWPQIENALTIEMICTATALRCADMIQSGVTSFYDCTEAPNALPGVLSAQEQIVKNAGLRAILSFEATERISAENGQLGLKENADFVKACRDHAGLIQGMMCHHTLFTCSDKFIRQAYSLAEELDCLLHAHVSEGTFEPEFSLKKYNQRPLQHYQSLGVLSPRFLASQCVQIDDTEIDLLAQTQTKVSHMPLSNCEVGGGIAPIPQLTSLKTTLGLGSDGYIDDFFQVMRGAFLIHKANQVNPQVMPAPLVWYLATEGGTQALDLKNVGRIEKGWKADLQLIDAKLPTPLTASNLYEQLILYRSPTDVKSVWVDGVIKKWDGVVLDADWETLQAHTREAAAQLWQRR